MATYYIESSVVSYYTADLSRDAKYAERQRLTRAWFDQLGLEHSRFSSEIVVNEVALGNAGEAQRRLELIQGMIMLAVDSAVDSFATELMRKIGLPPRLRSDALHMALAAIGHIEYLVTWNMKHMANPTVVARYHRLCFDRGHPCPLIATPQQLLGGG